MPPPAADLHSADPAEFLAKVTDRIDGWCVPIAAHLTIELLRVQRRHDSASGLLEIGIYKGKYLSVLLREAAQTGSVVLGVDTFQFLDEAAVRGILGEFFPQLDSLLRTSAGPSTGLSSWDIEKLLGGRPRFVSLDGSHLALDVQYDLNLAASVTSEAGIVSVDDFINPMTLGVNQAMARFMIAGGGDQLSPFFYCTNKLFCCRPSYRDAYMQAAESFVRSHTTYREAAAFVKADAVWRGSVEVEYFGHKLLIVH